MKEIERFIHKENQKKWLEIFMIIEEIEKDNNIISFTYEKDLLTIKVGVNDYIRVNLKEVIE